MTWTEIPGKKNKMSMKKARIYIDEADTEKRREVERAVSRVLATYRNSVLAELDDEQITSLKGEGINVEVYEGAPLIKLRAVEFDPKEETPTIPAPMMMTVAEIETVDRNYWIVQFVGPMKPEWGNEIRSAGGKMHSYIPDNSFMVEMPPQVKATVEQLPFVSWIGLYEPAYKISPLLMGRRKKASPSELSTLSLAADTFKPNPEGNLNVLLHKPEDLARVTEEIERLGGEVIDSGKDVLRVSFDLSNVEKLVKMAEVKWVEPFGVPQLFNDIAAGIMNVQPVWSDFGLDGKGQIVAVADTGLDTGVDDASMHDDFQGRIVNIYDRAGDGADDPRSGHGTHVAGSVLGNGSQSNENIRGMAPAARLVFQALENAVGSLAGIPADYNVLFQQAYDDGARIHTNSWGATEDIWGNSLHGQYTSQSEDIDEFMWDHKDILILFAAANDGIDANADGVVDTDSLSVQATAKNCVTVGASENDRPTGSNPPPGADIDYGTGWPTDFTANPIDIDQVSNNPDGMAAFSGRGPTDDGRPKPDVIAPGTNILSVRSDVATGEGWGLLPVGDPRRPFYMYMGGTSMSTPLTTGTVALIRQYIEDVCFHNNPSGALLKAMLIHGATPMTGQYTPPEVGPVPCDSQGWGRVNLSNSLFPENPVKMEFRDDLADTLGTGDQKDHSFKVVDATVPFRATLVWTDYPSDPATGGGLVNTLRLSVIDPNNATTVGAPADNNVQQVAIDNPVNGKYTVRVEGVNIVTQVTTGEQQDYALVISGGLDAADVYIKDNPADVGRVPSTGIFYNNSDIVVRQMDDGVFLHQPAKKDQTNYIYVKVHNLGPAAARTVKVTMRTAPYAGTEFVYPQDWTSVNTLRIEPDGIATGFPNIAPGESAIAKFSMDRGMVDKLYGWKAAKWHPCLLARVQSYNDDTDVGVRTWQNNNLAQRNLTNILVTKNTKVVFPFVIGHLLNGERSIELVIDRSKLPRDIELLLDPQDTNNYYQLTGLPPLPGTLIDGSRFSLRGAELVTILGKKWIKITGKVAVLSGKKNPGQIGHMSLHFTASSAGGTQPYEVNIDQRNAKSKVVGGVSLNVKVSICFIATAAYGSPLAEELDAFRGFRDSFMATNTVGKTFVKAYYWLSPPFASLIARSEQRRRIVRKALDFIRKNLAQS
ncbi:hypothetical protein ES703_24999 [subsurface metagenome]